eukprot:jgi/Chlat1/5933/Chrsp4S06259
MALTASCKQHMHARSVQDTLACRAGQAAPCGLRTSTAFATEVARLCQNGHRIFLLCQMVRYLDTLGGTCSGTRESSATTLMGTSSSGGKAGSKACVVHLTAKCGHCHQLSSQTIQWLAATVPGEGGMPGRSQIMSRVRTGSPHAGNA